MFKALKALVAGVVAGTALGVLFSPKKGKDLRKGIKGEIDEGGTGLSAVKETLMSLGKDLGETAKDCYDEVSKTDEYKEGKAAVKKAYKKHVPAKTRRKVKKAVTQTKAAAKKAKTVAKKASKTAKKVVKRVKKSK